MENLLRVGAQSAVNLVINQLTQNIQIIKKIRQRKQKNIKRNHLTEMNKWWKIMA